MRLLLLLWITLAASATSVAEAPAQYGHRIVDKMPQNTRTFVQGLTIVDGTLYVSSGGYGDSRLLRFNMEDGALVDGRRLDNRLFAEGATVLDGRVYQLTWRAGVMLIYEQDSLNYLKYHRIPGEGWGLTHDGNLLIYSDGSDKLYFMNPQSGKIEGHLAVTENGKPLRMLNELEWIEGEIWANVWRSERIVTIDPQSGEVTASIDFTGLRPDSTRGSIDNVLNGIAKDPATGAIWVTGKRWPWIYQIERTPLSGTEKEAQAETSDSR